MDILCGFLVVVLSVVLMAACFIAGIASTLALIMKEAPEAYEELRRVRKNGQ